jgi:hypothetical protein
MNYATKNNSKMLVIVCPTIGATPIENLNAICRVVELSGGMIVKPCRIMENIYYDTIAREEESEQLLPY